ncbi:tyrosine-type recombinase/integrase [Heyndrickxia ginsengihumi]|uniref:tyrosine-type recombinase/integrase n=1 Tax=Heyndrickxia ginsengihumi TaxID=363870 RepID=UPI0020403FE8|nr:site-specific integrase [Heyndrickxia ginsengihumi]MCM3024646.1 site-specific integrase [Heyndrickxia ginsengihumi]
MGKSTDEIIKSIDTNQFLDSNMANSLIHYLESYKTRTSLQESSFKNVVYSFLKIVPLFKEIFLEDLSWELFRNIAINNLTHIKPLFSFYIFLVENNLLKMEEVNRLLHLIDYLKKGLSKSALLEICQEKNPLKYFSFLIESKNNNTLFYLNIDNDFVLNLLKEYVALSPQTNYAHKKFFSLFSDSLSTLEDFKKINDIYDFNYSVFESQFNYYASVENSKYLRILVNFYVFLFQKTNNHDLFGRNGKVDFFSIKKPSFIKAYQNGYRTVYFNPIDPVPQSDNWFLNVNGFDYNTSSINDQKSVEVSFAEIKNMTYRNWVKEWLWKDNQSLYTKVHSLTQIIYFFNYIEDLKNGVVSSIYVKRENTKSDTITLNEVLAYKNHIFSTIKNNRTINSYIYNPRAVLVYLSNEKITEVESGVFYHLKAVLDTNYNNSKAIADEDLKKLSAIMKSKADGSYEDALYYAIFYIALETEFRISQIVNLKIDCVHGTAKKNEYVIKSITKTSQGELVEQPITIYVKRHIDEILKITKPLRDACPVESTKTYLFIKEANKKGLFNTVSEGGFNTFLRKCCEEAGIEKVTASNLRDTHMTKAEEFIIRNALSDVEQSILTGHKNVDTTSRHYIENQIKEMLETIHGAIIGNVDINGQIIEKADERLARKENEVSNQCGYCSSDSCHNFTYLDCMMCNSFVATVDRIPYFEEQIKVIDEKIKLATSPHSKEDLVNIKQLLLNYLKALLLKKEEITHEI